MTLTLSRPRRAHAAPRSTNWFGLASVVMGGIAFTVSITPVLCIMGWLPAALTIVLGCAGIALHPNRTLPLAGLALGAIAAALVVPMTIIYVFTVGTI